MQISISKQTESAAYHEAAHMTAAIVQAMPIRATGLHVDLYGSGRADYFQREPGDSANTELDQVERKRTIIAIYAAHAAQFKFYPEVVTGGWYDDLSKIQRLLDEMALDTEQVRSLREDLQARASKLVDVFWPIIEDLAKALLSRDCTPLLASDTWASGIHQRNMLGSEIVDFFASRKITATVISDNLRNFDSTQGTPHYDSLA